MDPFAAIGLASSGASLLGGLFGGGDDGAERARQENLARYRMAIETLQGGRQSIRDAYRQMLRNQDATDAAVRGAIGTGDAQAAGIYRNAYRDLEERARQTREATMAGLQRSGLGSSSVMADLRRAVAADTSRQATGIARGESAMIGDLAGRRAGVESQLGSQRNAMLSARTDRELNLNDSLASAYLSRQDVGTQRGNPLEGFGQFGGMLLGLAGTGGGGGGGILKDLQLASKHGLF